MPLVVDHDAVRFDILMALQECIKEKPLMNITIRDIAKKAQMPHSKLLYYFKDKKEIIISYIKYTRDYMSEKCIEWFVDHPRESYASKLQYMNSFMEYVATGKTGENRPNGTTQTYILAHYDEDVAGLVREEFRQWRLTMRDCLNVIYEDEADIKEAEAMMILIAGTFICNYNNALTGEINNNIIGYIGNLTKA